MKKLESSERVAQGEKKKSGDEDALPQPTKTPQVPVDEEDRQVEEYKIMLFSDWEEEKSRKDYS